LEVRLDGADNLVPDAIHMYLVDVVQHCMGLVTIAWAQLEEQCVADGWICEPQNLSLDLGLQRRAVHSGHCEVEICWLEVVGAVLQGLVEDGGLNLSHGKSAKTVSPLERHQVVSHVVAIQHGMRRLRELNVVLYLKGGHAWWINVDQVAEVEADLNSNKLDVWPMAICDCTIDDWQWNRHVSGCHCIVDLVARVVVEA
jgi:hypothetical protein